MDKAHVEHAVGLVEHEHLHAGQVHHATLHEVLQAPGRGDEHVGTAAQLLDLGAVGRPAEHRGGEVAGLARDLHARAGDLLGELAGGAHHEHARRAVAALHAGERAQHGQQERGRLAGAGAGGRDDVAAFQDERDGLLLDGGGVLVAQLLNRREGVLGQAEVGEFRHKGIPFLFDGRPPLRNRSVVAPAPAACLALDSSRFLHL